MKKHVRQRSCRQGWMLPASIFLLLGSGCATPTPQPPVQVNVQRQASLPTLPSEARVSRVTPPPECVPSCTEGLSRLYQELADMLMSSESED